jgi:hypothetical protein
MWTSSTTDTVQKHFQFGYYAISGVGNFFNYQFGQSFKVDMDITSVTTVSNGVLNVLGNLQSKTTMTFDITLPALATF